MFEQPEQLPIVVRPPVEQQPVLIDLHQPTVPMDPPTAEQVRAAEAAFTRQEKESATAAGIMAMWAAGMIAPDILMDFKTAIDDEEEEPARKPKLPDPK